MVENIVRPKSAMGSVSARLNSLGIFRIGGGSNENVPPVPPMSRNALGDITNRQDNNGAAGNREKPTIVESLFKIRHRSKSSVTARDMAAFKESSAYGGDANYQMPVIPPTTTNTQQHNSHHYNHGANEGAEKGINSHGSTSSNNSHGSSRSSKTLTEVAGEQATRGAETLATTLAEELPATSFGATAGTTSCSPAAGPAAPATPLHSSPPASRFHSINHVDDEKRAKTSAGDESDAFFGSLSTTPVPVFDVNAAATATSPIELALGPGNSSEKSAHDQHEPATAVGLVAHDDVYNRCHASPSQREDGVDAFNPQTPPAGNGRAEMGNSHSHIRTLDSGSMTPGPVSHGTAQQVQGQQPHTRLLLQQQQQNDNNATTPPPRQPQRYRSVRRSSRDDEDSARLTVRVSALEAETERMFALAREKQADLDRLKARLGSIPAQPQQPTTPTSTTKTRSPVFEKLARFARGRLSESNNNVRTSTGSSFKATSTAATSPSKAMSGDYTDMTTAPSSPTAAEKAAEKAAAQGFSYSKDAPSSNSSNQNMVVRFKDADISLPITHSTTAANLICSAATRPDGEDINHKKYVIVEQWRALGLERRLRCYERIRNISNGWDVGSNVSLGVVTASGGEQEARLLSIQDVLQSDKPPSNGFTMQLYHTQKPGKWQKRWVTLHDSGEISSSKRQDHKLHDKDVTQLCHLSDFDIFTFTNANTRKAFKPPKQHCYAIKSLTRPLLFQNGENYVHFFSMDEDDVAGRFYELVHGWRSWYLVNKQIDFDNTPAATTATTTKEVKPLLELQVRDVSPFATPSKNFTTGRDVGGATRMSVDDSRKESANPKPRMPVDTSKPTGFSPLINPNEFKKPSDEFGTSTLIGRAMSKRAADAPSARQKGPLLQQDDSGPFARKGLLGAVYDERKDNSGRNPLKLTLPSAKIANAFTEGPTLLNGGKGIEKASSPTSPKYPKSPVDEEKPKPQPWFPSAVEHTAAYRRARSLTAGDDQIRKAFVDDQNRQTLVGSQEDRSQRYQVPQQPHPRRLAPAPRGPPPPGQNWRDANNQAYGQNRSTSGGYSNRIPRDDRVNTRPDGDWSRAEYDGPGVPPYIVNAINYAPPVPSIPPHLAAGHMDHNGYGNSHNGGYPNAGYISDSSEHSDPSARPTGRRRAHSATGQQPPRAYTSEEPLPPMPRTVVPRRHPGPPPMWNTNNNNYSGGGGGGSSGISGGLVGDYMAQMHQQQHQQQHRQMQAMQMRRQQEPPLARMPGRGQRRGSMSGM